MMMMMMMIIIIIMMMGGAEISNEVSEEKVESGKLLAAIQVPSLPVSSFDHLV